MNENLSLRREIAERLLGCALDDGGFAPCPGKALHNARSGRRDFQVMLDGAPSGRCFHASCGEIVEDFNRRLRSLIGKAEAAERRRAAGYAPSGSFYGKVAPEPHAVRGPKRPPYDAAKLEAFAKQSPMPISSAWLAARSPVPIPAEQGPETSLLFLRSIYQPRENSLIFTREFSQGDFLWTGGGTSRLGAKPGVPAVPSPLPTGGPFGVWFLANPVSGQWAANLNNRDEHGAPKLGRRHQACITSWRFLVLESDEAPAELWARALVMLPLPVVAIYTSGGRSIHALCRVNAASKEEWDGLRDDLLPILSPLGADPASMTAVRLTRLPGALRFGKRGPDGKQLPFEKPKMQRLLYLNPAARARPILDPPA